MKEDQKNGGFGTKWAIRFAAKEEHMQIRHLYGLRDPIVTDCLGPRIQSRNESKSGRVSFLELTIVRRRSVRAAKEGWYVSSIRG